MAGKWIQPFPRTSDLGELELQSTASEPWLDVEIVDKVVAWLASGRSTSSWVSVYRFS